jgi:hypothetical protein
MSAHHSCSYGRDENAKNSEILVGKLEGKIPFGKPTRRWEDNIKMKLE